jgi:hypothetical protein
MTRRGVPAAQILSKIETYALDIVGERDDGFLTLIASQVRAGEPVRMCLPAFPFKSPNSADKVLGRLPDMAEGLAAGAGPPGRAVRVHRERVQTRCEAAGHLGRLGFQWLVHHDHDPSSSEHTSNEGQDSKN